MKKFIAIFVMVIALTLATAGPAAAFGPLPPPPVEGQCSWLWGPPCMSE